MMMGGISWGGGIGRRYSCGNDINKPQFWATRGDTTPLIGVDMSFYVG